MTNAPKKKKAAKKAAGRPPKNPGDKLEQFSIRLTPKLKFGLELLARAQNRSLSQAVEWALQVGLNSYRVNNEGENVADLLDSAWTHEHPFDRLYSIYNSAPNLLTFDDRAACELVENSMEMNLANEYLGIAAIAEHMRAPNEAAINGDELKKSEVTRKHRLNIAKGFVRAFWEKIRGEAIEHVNSGKLLEGVSIHKLIGVKLPGGIDMFAVMQALTDYKNGELDSSDVVRRIIDLDNDLSWSNNYKKRTHDELEALIAQAPQIRITDWDRELDS